MIWGGEFHYWRTPPDAWRNVFRSMRALGFNTVSTYVPWDFHEITPGRYDFAGRSSAARNLLGWIELAKAHRLKIILRPGPYIYAEWNDKGPPAHVARHARLSKSFLSPAAHWIRAVGRAVRPYLASRGGPIIAVQVCNEVMGAFEYEGFGDPKMREIDAIYAGWMQAHFENKRRGRMPRIPAHWGGGHLETAEFLRRYGPRYDSKAQFLAFHEWYTEEYLRKMAAVFRGAGFDVPLFANLVSWYWPQHWAAMQESLDFVAMDTYYPESLPGNLPAAFTKCYRQFSAISHNPLAAEFGCGVWDGMHERLGMPDQRHLEFTTLLALAQGVRGISYYMLVNRDNWYLAPINEWGKVRERFAPVIRSLGKVIAVLAKDEYRPVSTVGLVWNRSDHKDFVFAGKKYDHNAFDRAWFKKNRYEEDYDEFWYLYEKLLELGYDVQILDSEDGRKSWPRATVFPVTGRWDGACEDLAKRHLKRGGCLVLVGDKAAEAALKMPPSIGTPVQKWVRDLGMRERHRIGEALQGLGEMPRKYVDGKSLLQFARVNARGQILLFVFSLAHETQEIAAASKDARLIPISSGDTLLNPNSGAVFYLHDVKRSKQLQRL